MTPLLSFHGDDAVKIKYVERLKAHHKADELKQGRYWDGSHGCAVGCTLDRSDNLHEAYPEELGIPQFIAHLHDHIFESLPAEEAKDWALNLLETIPVGVEIPSTFSDRFQVFWLERQKTQIEESKFPDVAASISVVIDLLNKAISGDEPESAAWSAGYSEARVKRDWILTELKSLK